MAETRSNLPQVAALLDNLAATVDFTRPGAEGSLGDDVLDIIATGISDRSRMEEDPAGGEWAANRGKYGQRKRGRGLPVGVGFVRGGPGGGGGGGSGVMLSLPELKGTRVIEPQRASMSYGTSDDARRLGEWFTNGATPGPDGGEASGAPGQPPRPFYEYTTDDEAEVTRRVEEFVRRELDAAR
jgi:hypothetical protein